MPAAAGWWWHSRLGFVFLVSLPTAANIACGARDAQPVPTTRAVAVLSSLLLA